MNARVLTAILLAVVTLPYIGHFQNGFHFDDLHTVVQNPYIRDPRNIPRFFKDARTFSVEARNRVYRPVVSTTLALDYWLGGGLKPFWFHLSTFLLYLLQLLLMFFLFRIVYGRARPHIDTQHAAFFAAALYGLHPAMAETVNYVIQRADLYNALGVVAGIVIYASAPNLRLYGFYSIPVALAILSKPPALVFPALLLAYLWLFEEPHFLRALLRAVPAFVVTGLCAVLTIFMTPRNFNGAGASAYAYRITQPLVAFRYFRTFFLPGGLTADTDLTPVASVWARGAWIGFVFLALVLAAIWLTFRKREWKPVAFGLVWFLVALVPTSIYPLGEVENDHRMFFPFVGLAMAAAWPIALFIRHLGKERRTVRIAVAVLCCFELATLALGTVQRNMAWRTEESLWRDVTEKSPQNARGWLNYGSSLIEKQKYAEAIAALKHSKQLSPWHAVADLNLGVALWKLGKPEEAESAFLQSIKLRPGDPRSHYFYASFLAGGEREKEALEQLKIAADWNPDYLDSIYLAMRIHALRSEWKTVMRLGEYVVSHFPKEDAAKVYMLMAARESGMDRNGPEIRRLGTPENYLNLSAYYYQHGGFDESIATAREALKLRPRYADAYNNIAAAYRAVYDWDASIEASRQALAIRPGMLSAKRNLELAQRKEETTAP